MGNPEVTVVDCQDCAAHTEAELHGAVYYRAQGDEPGGRYALASCKRCGSPLLIRQRNEGTMAEGDIWGSSIRLYPGSRFHINPAAPELVRRSYAEAIACHAARAYTGAALLCRRGIEGVCAAHGVRERNLALSLAKLREQGVINEHLFEWADMLRVAGNAAAHDVAVSVSAEDARDMLEFTGAIVDYVFSFRDKFEAFKKRRADGSPASEASGAS